MKIIAVQMRSVPGSREKNIEEAERLIADVDKHDKTLVVLPELFAAGYVANEKIKDLGEGEDGRTLCWMKMTAREKGIYLAGGLAVYEDGDLYNRYYLVSPEGEVEGYSQKYNGEAYCFRFNEGKYLIESSIGRLAAVICADNHKSHIIKEIQTLKPDLLIMPHAWPSIEQQDSELRDFVKTVRDLVKVPVVFVNPVGTMDRMRGLFGSIMARMGFGLRGHSMILDRRGKELAGLKLETGLLSAELGEGRSDEPFPLVPDYAGSIVPGSAIIRRVIIPIDVFFGKRFYNRNIRKR